MTGGKNNDKYVRGRIAERIVANELEYLGFRVSDLNKEGTAANADLLAARNEMTLQIQVKGAKQAMRKNGWEPWWFQYGFCNEAIISGTQRMFNSCESFYRAEFVVLVAYRKPNDYKCVVLPEEIAEKAAQLALDHDYRILSNRGTAKKPHMLYTGLEPYGSKDERKRKLRDDECKLIAPYVNNWTLLLNASEKTMAAAR